jgi:hypothetical protein
MTQDELYYMTKIEESGHWPWELADVLTPTPPEERTDMLTPTPTPPSSLETTSLKNFVQSTSRRHTRLQQPKAQFAQQTVEHEKSKWQDTEEADSPKEALDGHKIKMWRAMLSETKRLLRWCMKVYKHGIYLSFSLRSAYLGRPWAGKGEENGRG